MHELSIANNILEIVQQHVQPELLPSVRSIRLKVGDQAGVVVDSLEFSFSALTADSPLRSAHLEVERVPFTITCRDCGATSVSDAGLVTCPKCDSTRTTVLSGTELRVVDIELLEPEPEGA